MHLAAAVTFVLFALPATKVALRVTIMGTIGVGSIRKSGRSRSPQRNSGSDPLQIWSDRIVTFVPCATIHTRNELDAAL
jgi:hypothetical protein